jgi:hypothetical protein
MPSPGGWALKYTDADSGGHFPQTNETQVARERCLRALQTDLDQARQLAKRQRLAAWQLKLNRARAALSRA